MLVNNLELIKPLLDFSDPDTFYHLQLIKRKKEHPDLGSNSRSFSHYYVNSPNYLDTHWEEITKICDAVGARAMINLNKRSFKESYINTRETMLEYEKAGNYKYMYRAFSKAVARNKDTKSKLWILDFDFEENSNGFDSQFHNEVCAFIKSIRPINKDRIFTIIPSRNGYHLVTTPFDKKAFSDKYPDIDLKKNSSTNLYIPEI
jgi:hypothetical protein